MLSIRSTYTDNTRIAFRPKGNRSRSGRWDVAFNRAEGPAVRPALGNALGNGENDDFFSGPTGQWLSSRRGEFLARWADRTTKRWAFRSSGRCPGLGERMALWAEPPALGDFSKPPCEIPRENGVFSGGFLPRPFVASLVMNVAPRIGPGSRADVLRSGLDRIVTMVLLDDTHVHFLPPCYHGRWPIS